MSRDWCTLHGDGVRIVIVVQPNAKKTEVVGEVEGALKIRLKALPIEGRANEELIRFIADQLQLPKKHVCLTHGVGSRQKLLQVASPLSEVQVRSILLPQNSN